MKKSRFSVLPRRWSTSLGAAAFALTGVAFGQELPLDLLAQDDVVGVVEVVVSDEPAPPTQPSPESQPVADAAAPVDQAAPAPAAEPNAEAQPAEQPAAEPKSDASQPAEEPAAESNAEAQPAEESGESASETTSNDASAAESMSEKPLKPRVYTFDAPVLACVTQCPECGVFSRAIRESGLEELIGGAKRITIFVPVDDAFANWPEEKLEQLFQCKPALVSLVLNHICPESLSPADLAKLRAIASCCNYDDCVKYCGKKRADECAFHCSKIGAKRTEKQTVSGEDGGVCLGNGALCQTAAYPEPVIRCANGYVYPIDRVQIPRGLKVYQALKAQAESPDDASIEFELVEILIPSETPSAEAAPATEESKATETTDAPKSDEQATEAQNARSDAPAEGESESRSETKADAPAASDANATSDSAPQDANGNVEKTPTDASEKPADSTSQTTSDAENNGAPTEDEKKNIENLPVPDASAPVENAKEDASAAVNKEGEDANAKTETGNESNKESNKEANGGKADDDKNDAPNPKPAE